MSQANEPIIKRSAKLSHLIFDPPNNNSSVINRETLLDAMNVLIEEAGKDGLRSDRNFSKFAEKFRYSFNNVKSLRVNLSDFETKNIIGRGHFGEVQVVREKNTGNFYAMKILHKEETLSQCHIAFYEEERDIMAKSSSPWITQLKYAFQDLKNLYLVMEFHPGGDLLGLLSKHDDILSEKVTKFYLSELVQAIHSLHEMGYAHRDIKPDNILIDRTGHIKLADFGSAAKLQIDGKVRSEMPVGTPDYIAPEVLMAMNDTTASMKSSSRAPKGYGAECDWWSLGIVAFQMLYGYPPFTDDKVITTYSNIMNFKETLKFPPNDEEVYVSDLSQSLILGLLDDADHRIRFKELRDHGLFDDVNWSDLLQVVPPFVPSICSQDDTSNFEEFEQEVHRTSRIDNTSKARFNSNHLPFIGFTYNHHAGGLNRRDSERRSSFHNISLDSSVTDSPSRNKINNLETQLKSKKNEIRALQRHLQEYEDKDLTNQLEVAESKLKSAKQSLESANEDRGKMKREAMNHVNDIANLKRMIDAERNARISSESKACALVEAIKEKYKEQVEIKQLEMQKLLEKQEGLISELEVERNKVNQLEMSNKNAIKELKDCQDSFEVFRSDHFKNKLEQKGGLEDIQTKLEKLSQSTAEQVSELQDKLHKMEILKNTAENNVRKLQQKLKNQAEANSIAVNTSPDKHGQSLSKCYVQQTQEYCVALQLHLADLKMTEEKANGLELQLNEEVQQNKKLRAECAKLEMELNDLRLPHNESHSSQIVALEDKMKDLESSFEDAETKKLLMESSSTERMALKDHLTNLQHMQAKLESSLKTLETGAIDSVAVFNKEKTDIHQENLYLRTKVVQLESQLRKSKDISPEKDKAKINQLNDKLRKLEAEMNNLHLDLKIKDREIKSVEEKLQWSREMQREQRNKLKVSEEARDKLQKSEEDLKKSVREYERQLDNKKEMLNKVTNEQETVKAKLDTKIQVLQENCGLTKQLEEKYAKSQGQYDEICKQNKVLTSELDILKEAKTALQKDFEILKDEIAQKRRKIENLEININVQKSTCKMLEDQIGDFEVLLAMHEEVKDTLESDMNQLKVEINAQKSENIKDKKTSELVRKERDATHEVIKELRVEIETQTAIHEMEITGHMNTIQKLNGEITALNSKLYASEKMCSEEQLILQNSTEKLDLYEQSVVELKEEAARHMTQISSLKQSNIKLSEALAETLDNYELTKSELRDVNADADSAAVNYEQEKVKMMETIAQQTKLIDFLQQKTESLQEKKKKTIFGGIKSNVKSSDSTQWREMEQLLRKERQKNRILQEQVTKARTEVMSCHNEMTQQMNNVQVAQENHVNGKHSVVPTSPKSRAVLSVLTASPCSSIPSEEMEDAEDGDYSGLQKDFRQSLRFPQKQRMHHNIPHRFNQFLAMRGTKCSACLDTIHLGRQAMKCQECHVISHTNCVHAVPSSCGLPPAFVDHFTSTLSQGIASSPSIPVDRDCDLYEGWVKVPSSKKQGWEKRYMQLNNDQLKFFSKENVNSSPVDVFDLNVAKSNPRCLGIIVSGAVSHSELVNTAKSDIPYILKIEWMPLTTCWPGRTLYVMAESLSQKKLWVVGLEAVIKNNTDALDSASLYSSSLNSKIIQNVIYKVNKDSLTINCSIIYVQKWLFLGATEGLFAVDLDEDAASRKLLKIDGVDNVFQMCTAHHLNIVVLLLGTSRELKIMTYDQVDSTLSSHTVPYLGNFSGAENVNGCHLIAVGGTSAEKSFVTIALSSSVSIYKWNVNQSVYNKMKEIKTIEPCSCMHFTDHTVLFGSDKFYEMDLQYFSVEEFLDETDSTLAFAIYGASQLSSFPMAIIEVSPSNKTAEYLLCFNDFAVFVDDFGRRTRKDEIKWTKLPISIHYRAPYLYIVHFSAVEVCKIPDAEEQSMLQACMDIANPHFLGPAISDTAIYVVGAQGENTEIICIQGNLNSDGFDRRYDKLSLSNSDQEILGEANTSATSSGEFTFTDSIVASLDDVAH